MRSAANFESAASDHGRFLEMLAQEIRRHRTLGASFLVGALSAFPTAIALLWILPTSPAVVFPVLVVIGVLVGHEVVQAVRADRAPLALTQSLGLPLVGRAGRLSHPAVLGVYRQQPVAVYTEMRVTGGRMRRATRIVVGLPGRAAVLETRTLGMRLPAPTLDTATPMEVADPRVAAFFRVAGSDREGVSRALTPGICEALIRYRDAVPQFVVRCAHDQLTCSTAGLLGGHAARQGVALLCTLGDRLAQLRRWP